DSQERRVVAEGSPIEHELHSTSEGYVSSKWVSERVVKTASERGVPCNIFRLGLMWADSEGGRYDELQREYRFLKSCLLSGYGIKHYRYAMPPTPVDYAARAMTHLSIKHSAGGGVFHISATQQPDENLIERCAEIAGVELQMKSWSEWISQVRRLHDDGIDLP